MKHIALLIFTLYSFSGLSQTYGNEWINYNQQYYSFKVYPENGVPTYFGDQTGVNTGIYLLDYNTLNSAGVPLASISTENFQIFGREKEIPLYIQDGGDGQMNPGDFILFYTQRNDGWLDSTIYEDPNSIGNSYYSLYNDTINYFFTWNSSTNNLRYQIESDTDFASYTPASYILYDRWQSNTAEYLEGERLSESSSSFYTKGEGWSGGKTNGVGGSHPTWNAASVQLKYPFQGVGAPDVIYTGTHLSASDANNSGGPNHHVKYEVGNPPLTIYETTWTGYDGLSINTTFPVSVLPTGIGPSGFVIDIVDDLGVATDYQSIATWAFKYPRLLQFEGEDHIEFEIVNSTSESKIRLDLNNVFFSNPLMFVHGDTPMAIPVIDNSGVYSALIPNSTNGVNQHVIYQDFSSLDSVDALSPVNGSGYFTDYSSINFDNALLMIYHQDLASASQNYADYRGSMNGGSYDTVLANVDELYLQFGGGIEKHINGIRRFAHYAYNQSTQKPVGLFLMGKGIKEATVGANTGYRKNPSLFPQTLIPSFGEPPSDICLTAGLEGSYNWTPLMPTGRISARTEVDLQSYLDKVIEFENEQDSLDVYDTPNKDWQKQIIHFAGGSDITQQSWFQGYMNNYESIIEQDLFGGNVMRVYKSDSDPLNPAILQSVTDRISDGVSLMSYFGHASSTGSGFEINLDDPLNWNNQGKYPLMLVNSCYNGNLFLTDNSNSEEFVLTPNAGAIGYIASTNIGYAGQLNAYSNQLYRQMGYINYGKPIGFQQMRTIEEVEDTMPNNLYYETTCTQMLLHGDPLLHLNHHNKPEIELLAENVWFTPEDLNLTVDSITMHIYLKNLGRSVTDTFSLEVIRDFPGSNDDSVYTFQLPKLHYETEFTFSMPLQGNIGLGLNSFEISVDLPSYIQEQYDELNNNRITKTLFIDVDGIIPVIPYEFAVVPNDSVTVIASTNNPIADFNTYRFEIDTIDFEGAPSPEHRFALVSGYGGIKEVNPSEWTSTLSPGVNDTLVCQDSVVYFWRVSIDGDTTWRESSFQYIAGKQGWGQDHFFQFKKNTFSGLNYNRSNRLREYFADDKTLSVDVYNDCGNAPLNGYYINGNQEEYGLCTCSPSLYVAIIDPVTHEPWGTRYGTANPGNDFGNANDNGACRARVEDYFIYRQNNGASLAAFQDLINTQVPDSFYILIYTPLVTNYTSWESLDSAGMFGLFSSLGSDSIYAGRPNLPFAFFCKKGDPNSVVEYCAQNSSDDFTMNAILKGYANVGVESAPLIGPSNNWGNVYWKQDPMELPVSDSTVLTIKAYDAGGNWQFNIDTLFTPDDSILNLNSIVDASLYPYINLSAYYLDSAITPTPAQIDRWHVLFDPLPEAAIDGSTLYTWSASGDINEGDNVEFAVDVKNIFSVDMDSLLISYWIEDQNNIPYPISYPRQDSLKVGETLRDTISFSTAGFAGINSFWMEVNPYIDPAMTITDQPEQMHFNNLLQIPFNVRPDTINPILDVTFDGNHILNGDIVSPNSEILITLKDENTFLIMDEITDTTHFGVYLTDPLGNQEKIPFVDGQGTTIMQWIPATQQNRRFKIIWPGEFDMDGTYSLLVQGEDKSGNVSGDIEYRVNFEIIHESTITNMMNYPNPFSTSTRFVFTLTGSQEPDEVIIQIMTVTGRVVREITEDELGIITIGRNITEYAWDGTDEFGDPLANGVYLYRVKAQINGEDIKRRESGADQFFEKDFGKMYLLR